MFGRYASLPHVLLLIVKGTDYCLQDQFAAVRPEHVLRNATGAHARLVQVNITASYPLWTVSGRFDNRT
jgi:hypothetical protein